MANHRQVGVAVGKLEGSQGVAEWHAGERDLVDELLDRGVRRRIGDRRGQADTFSSRRREEEWCGEASQAGGLNEPTEDGCAGL